MGKKIASMARLKKDRVDMKHAIENALGVLGWSRTKLAKEYGVYMREGEYTKGRISQLIRVNKGEEENSENMLKWMLDRIKENK